MNVECEIQKKEERERERGKETCEEQDRGGHSKWKEQNIEESKSNMLWRALAVGIHSVNKEQRQLWNKPFSTFEFQKPLWEWLTNSICEVFNWNEDE